MQPLVITFLKELEFMAVIAPCCHAIDMTERRSPIFCRDLDEHPLPGDEGVLS
jgi:hypothetical protein